MGGHRNIGRTWQNRYVVSIAFATVAFIIALMADAQ